MEIKENFTFGDPPGSGGGADQDDDARIIENEERPEPEVADESGDN